MNRRQYRRAGLTGETTSSTRRRGRQALEGRRRDMIKCLRHGLSGLWERSSPLVQEGGRGPPFEESGDWLLSHPAESRRRVRSDEPIFIADRRRHCNVGSFAPSLPTRTRFLCAAIERCIRAIMFVGFVGKKGINCLNILLHLGMTISLLSKNISAAVTGRVPRIDFHSINSLRQVSTRAFRSGNCRAASRFHPHASSGRNAWAGALGKCVPLIGISRVDLRKQETVPCD
jgi:hypothetical protein